jgi:hypothetical protein
MSVLEAAGLGAVARELLDRVNPSGSRAKQSSERHRIELGGRRQ